MQEDDSSLQRIAYQFTVYRRIKVHYNGEKLLIIQEVHNSLYRRLKVYYNGEYLFNIQENTSSF